MVSFRGSVAASGEYDVGGFDKVFEGSPKGARLIGTCSEGGAEDTQLLGSLDQRCLGHVDSAPVQNGRG